MPVPVQIAGRISSITNAFINSIVPSVMPTEQDVVDSLGILQLDPADLRCAYCGDKYSEWDHLRPLVVDQRPTGYISEIRNLVPSCGKCNQSKGNKNWGEWIISEARLSPKRRNIPDLTKRIERLKAYENWSPPSAQKLNLQELIGEDLWRQHWQNWQELLDAMRRCHTHAQEIANKLRGAAKG